VSLRRRLTPAILAGLGVSLAPIGWTLQHWVGFSVNQARCNGPTRGTAPVTAVTLAMTIFAVAIAMLGLACSAAALRATRDVEDDGPPPPGRVHFMAVVGIAITPLFVFIVLMSGIGTFLLPICRQS
jgi:Mn2+/Fe2+ NRAMP family transporter